MSRGFHNIPDDSKLQAMSYIQLLGALHSSEKDSPKFHAVEREIKKHLAKDQAKINRPNIVLGACIAGFFGLSGVVLGYCLRELPSKQIPNPDTLQQIHQSQLTPKQPLGAIQVGKPATPKKSENPAQVKDNAANR